MLVVALFIFNSSRFCMMESTTGGSLPSDKSTSLNKSSDGINNEAALASNEDSLLTTQVLVVGSGIAAYLSACAFANRGFDVTLFSNATLPVHTPAPLSSASSAPSTPSKRSIRGRWKAGVEKENGEERNDEEAEEDKNQFKTPTRTLSPLPAYTATSPATPGGSASSTSSPEARYVSLCAAGASALTRFPGLEARLLEAREKTRLSAVHLMESMQSRSEHRGNRTITEIGNGVHASIPFAAAAADSCCSSFASEMPRVHRLSGRISVEQLTVCPQAFITLSLATPSGPTTLRTRLLVAADGDAPWSVLWHLSQDHLAPHLDTRSSNLALTPVQPDRKSRTPNASQNLAVHQTEDFMRCTIQISADRANVLVHPSRALVIQPAPGLDSDRAFQLYMYPSFSTSRDRVACIHAHRDHHIWSVSTVDDMYKLFDLNFPLLESRKFIAKKAMRTFVESRPKPILVAKCLHTPATLVSAQPVRTPSRPRPSNNVSAVLFVGRSARVLPPDAPASLDSTLADAATVADALDFVLDAKNNSQSQHDSSSLDVTLRSLVGKYNELRSEELKALVQVVSQVPSLRGDHLVLDNNQTQATTSGPGNSSQALTPRTGRLVKQSAIASRLSKQADFNQLLLDQPSFVEMLRNRRLAQRRAVGASIVVPTIAAGLVRLVFRATTRLLSGRPPNSRRRLSGGSGGLSDGDSDTDNDD